MDVLDRLYREHATAVRAYALRRTDPTTADDVCAEVWAIAWRRLDEIPEDPLPWLLGVARRVLANQRRGRQRTAALRERLAGQTHVWTPAPDIPSDRTLAAALAQLRPLDREALMLIAWEELSPKQAAAALGIRPGTFAVRLHRARTRLAAALREAEEQPTHSIPAPCLNEETTR